MIIQTEQYKIAPLHSSESAVQVIRQAESTIAEMTGTKVTLIAYAKMNEEEQHG